MKNVYFKDKDGNFGDDLNGWLWQKLLPDIWDEDSSALFFGIGTIIGMLKVAPENKHVAIFSSGAGYSEVPKNLDDARWNIFCVRGPLTAQILNLPAEKAITDGAILLRLLPEYQPVPVEQRHGVCFMPHHRGRELDKWKNVCNEAGVQFLDPREDSLVTLEKIKGASLILAEAMHAAIVADSLRVPWVPVMTNHRINNFKWLDWAYSMKVPFSPLTLTSPSVWEHFNNILMRVLRCGYFNPALQNSLNPLKYNKIAIKFSSNTGIYKLWLRISRDFILSLTNFLQTLSMKSKFFSSLMGIDRSSLKYEQKCVEQLRALTKHKGFLSDEIVIDDRLLKMKDKVKELHQFALDLRSQKH